MSTYGCRHTLTQDFILQPWTLICTVCLQPIAPFTTVRRCTGCRCVLHEDCYWQMVSMTQAAGDIMEREARELAAASRTGDLATPWRSPHLASAAPPEAATTGQERAGLTTTTNQSPRSAALGTTVGASARSLAAATFSSPSKAFNALTERVSAASPTWWRPIPYSRQSPTATALTPSSPAATHHVHALRPTQFLFPLQCACCYTSKTPEERRQVAARAEDQSGGVVRITKEEAPSSGWMGLGTVGYECTTCSIGLHKVCLYCLPPSEYVLVAPQPRAMAGEEREEEPGSASSLVGDPMGSFLAFFGTTMPSFTSAETRERAEEGEGGKGGAERGTTTGSLAGGVPSSLKAAALASAFQQFMRGFQKSDKRAAAETREGEHREATAGTSALPSSSLTRNAGRSLITSYLDTSGRNSKNDPNVLPILESVFKLMDTLQDRHPGLLSGLFNPMNMHVASVADQELYARLCDELPDADFIVSATGREGRASRAEERGHRRAVAAAAARRADTASVATSDVTVWSKRVDGEGKRRAALPETEVKAEVERQKVQTATVNYLPEIQLLRDCLRFAIAVYGETYRKGFLSSLFGSALVFTVSKEDVASAPKEKNDAAVTEVLSLPRSALVLSRWSTKATEPSYCLLVDHIPQRIVLAFRGTLSDVDILTDVCAFGESFCGGMAHQGAARTVSRIFARREKREGAERGDGDPHKDVTLSAKADGDTTTTTSDALPSAPQLTTEDSTDNTDKLLDTLEKLATDYPTYQIIVTGHSLGGGLAVLFGVRLCHSRTFAESILARMRVVAFAPMPTLTLPSAAEYDEGSQQRGGTRSGDDQTPVPGRGSRYMFPIWSVVNGCDVVSRLQLNSLDRLCAHISGDPDGKVSAADGGGGGGERRAKRRPHRGTGGSGAEEEEEYGEEMQSPSLPAASAISTSDDATPPSLSQQSTLSSEFYHPGRVFMLTTPWEPKTNRLVEVPRGHRVMHQMFLMRPMLALHMLDNYTEGLRDVRSSLQVERSASAPVPEEEEDCDSGEDHHDWPFV